MAVDEVMKDGSSPIPYLIAEKAHVHPNFRDDPTIKAALELDEKKSYKPEWTIKNQFHIVWKENLETISEKFATRHNYLYIHL